MAFCKNCGTQFQDGAKFCPKCGTTTQSQAQINDVEANKIMAVIAYIGILVVVPLITGKYKNSPFLKFHVNQAIVFCIGWVVSGFLSLIPFIGVFLGDILSFAIFVLVIISIVGAVKGETKSLPLIEKVKIIK